MGAQKIAKSTGSGEFHKFHVREGNCVEGFTSNNLSLEYENENEPAAEDCWSVLSYNFIFAILMAIFTIFGSG